MTRPVAHQWSAARLAEAARLWAEGLSAGQIALKMGVTRSAICGQAHRHRALFPARKSSVPPSAPGGASQGGRGARASAAPGGHGGVPQKRGRGTQPSRARPWTGPERARLVELLGRRLSIVTIATALDRTPAAVRTYLRDHPDLFPALRQAQGDGSAEGRKRDRASAPLRGRAPAAEGGGAAPDIPANPTTFVDLDRGQCRWPVNLTDASGGPSMACCGAPVVDRWARPGRREATHCAFHLAAGTGRASGAPFVVRTTRKTRKDQPWDA